MENSEPSKASNVATQNEFPEVVRDLIREKSWDRDDLYDTSPHQIAHWHNEALEEVAMFFWEAFQSAESAVRMGLRVEGILRNQLRQCAAPSVEPEATESDSGSFNPKSVSISNQGRAQ
jgi:hypothetical protein